MPAIAPAVLRDRSALLDALKAGACLLIVAHHLAFYGPMSDAALPLAPALIGWLYAHGRLAVQLFLVVGGHLAAASLAPGGAMRAASAWRQIAQRYRRLVVPLLGALVVAVLAGAVARWGLGAHPAVPAEPNGWQLLAHGLLLHDLLDFEALSAGVWYVAIDLQLYALAVLLLQVRHSAPRAPARSGMALVMALVLVLAAASLLLFNRHAAMDETALYFFGAYGLGMLAFWIGQSRYAPRFTALFGALVVMVVVAALVVDFRSRIAVAVVVALALLWSQRTAGWRVPAPVQVLGRMSYSVFLIHFPVCLLVATVVTALWPGQPWPNAAGMVFALAASVLAGRWLHALLEVPPATWRRVFALQAMLLVTGFGVAALN